MNELNFKRTNNGVTPGDYLMSEDTYTIDDIKKAWANYWPSRIPSERSVAGLIKELTKP